MIICIVDSDIGSVRPTEPSALAQRTRKLSPKTRLTLGLGRLGALGPGSIRDPRLWAQFCFNIKLPGLILKLPWDKLCFSIGLPCSILKLPIDYFKL